MSIEKIKARDVRVGDRISLDGVSKPRFVVTAIEEGCRILGMIKARQITVANDAGQQVSQKFGLAKPMRRET